MSVSRLGPPAVSGTLFSAFGCLFEPIGFGVDGDDLGMMDEAINERGDAGGVREDVPPIGEGTICGDECALLLIAAADEFEEQIGMAV